ncbi:unnamed protein product, partial [Meganyctiphanes norvegica]
MADTLESDLGRLDPSEHDLENDSGKGWMSSDPDNIENFNQLYGGQSAEKQAELLLTFKNGGFTSSSSSSTSSVFSGGQEASSQEFNPLAALGLQRVGEERPSPSKEPTIALNRRGMPARIRKKNRMYFDDDLVSSPTQMKSPKKTPRGTPKKQSTPQHLILPPIKI